MGVSVSEIKSIIQFIGLATLIQFEATSEKRNSLKLKSFLCPFKEEFPSFSTISGVHVHWEGSVSTMTKSNGYTPAGSDCQWITSCFLLPQAGYCPQTKRPSDLFHPQFFFSPCPDFYISSLDPALRPRNRPKTEIHELCIAVCACVCVCVHSSVAHRRHNAVLQFAITQGCFWLYLTIFQRESFFFL